MELVKATNENPQERDDTYPRHRQRWYLCEHVNKKDKGNLLIAHGKVIDVTESVEPRLAGSAEYVRRLEAALVNKIKENYKLKGLTPMDTDIVRELESLREKVR